VGGPVTAVDLVLLAAMVAAAVVGYRQGLLVGAAGLVGFLLGGAAGLWLAPWVLGRMQPGPLQTLSAVVLVLGAALLLQLLGSRLATRVRDSVEWKPARVLDAIGGAAISIVGLLLAVWLVAGLLLETAGQGVADSVEASRVIGAVEEVVPGTAADVVDSFQGVVDASGFPEVFGPFGAERIIPVPPPDGSVAAAVVPPLAGSLVKVEGEACRRGLEGSGFVFAPERVMTNAHVIAGVERPTVQVSGVGPRLRATVVVFDPARDVAVLAVPGLRAATLPFADGARDGSEIAVAGFPGDGPLTAVPGRVRSTITALGRDIYDDRPVTRDVVSLRAEVRPGNSGGPLLDAQGRVAGVVFAASTSDPETGYALSVEEVAPLVDAGRAAADAVGTGPCTG
jgi:S1-C subfamily serine protease